MRTDVVAALVCLLAVGACAGPRPVAVDPVGLITDAVAAGAKRVQIPAGVYRLGVADPKEDWHVIVRKARDLEIDATGVTFVFTDTLKGGILFEECRGVTLKGLTLDYDPLPFTQGTVVGFEPEGNWYDLKVDAGYRLDADHFRGRIAAYVYDRKSRLLKADTWDMYPAKVTAPSAGVLRMHWRDPKPPGTVNVSAGDLMVLKRISIGCVYLSRCSGMRIAGVTIHGSSGIAIQESGGPGGNRFTYTVTRGPTPAGATAARLLSGNTDAFHSSGVRKGPLVENCRFEYQGDDGVAIHGAYRLVTADAKAARFGVAPKHAINLEPGDRLRLISGTTFGLKAEAVLKSVRPVNRPDLIDADVMEPYWKKYWFGPRNKNFYELTVDRPLAVALGDLVTSFDRNGSGFVVRNNVIRRHRARGILVKACDGVIEGNTLEGCTQTGIALGPEFGGWLEGTYVRNVVVRNNTIRRCGLGANVARNGGNPKVGAISISASTPGSRLSIGSEHEGIRIEGNRVEDCGVAGLLIACAGRVAVRNNVFVRTHQAADFSEAGKHYGLNRSAAVLVVGSKDVTFTGNRISDLPAGVKPYWIGPGCSGISGADSAGE